MCLGRIIHGSSGYEFIELDLAEVGKAIDNVLELNSFVWNRCVRKAQEFIEKSDDPTLDMHPAALAKTFFEAVSMKLYTELLGELQRKVFLAKNGQGLPGVPLQGKTDVGQSIQRTKRRGRRKKRILCVEEGNLEPGSSVARIYVATAIATDSKYKDGE